MSGPQRRSAEQHTGPAEHEHAYPGTSAAEAPGHRGKTPLSIWFFVGALCFMYGIVLFPLGIYQWSHPSATELALPLLLKLHTTFWWGLLLIVFGGFYVIRFRPGKI